MRSKLCSGSKYVNVTLCLKKSIFTLNDDTVGPDALELAVDVEEVEGVARLGDADGSLLQLRGAVAVRSDRVPDDSTFAGFGPDCKF